MNELLDTELNDEIKIRGQVLAVSLKLEDLLTKVIYSTFAPKDKSQDVLDLYLEEFILPTFFGRKVELFKKLLKTKTYQKKTEIVIDKKLSILKEREIFSTIELIEFLNKNLSEIVKTRNLIAHGKNLNYMNISEVDISKGDIVFANKLKAEIINQESLNAYTEKTILISFLILKIYSPEE